MQAFHARVNNYQRRPTTALGSSGTFAALVISDRFGKYRRSLRGARTVKMRTKRHFAAVATKVCFPSSRLLQSNL
jgi:hypothetical protein